MVQPRSNIKNQQIQQTLCGFGKTI